MRKKNDRCKKVQVKNLEDVVLQFTLGRGDVLLATSIIENGIDMPNVNSIVVMVSDGMCRRLFRFDFNHQFTSLPSFSHKCFLFPFFLFFFW